MAAVVSAVYQVDPQNRSGGWPASGVANQSASCPPRASRQGPTSKACCGRETLQGRPVWRERRQFTMKTAWSRRLVHSWLRSSYSSSMLPGRRTGAGTDARAVQTTANAPAAYHRHYGRE